MKIMQLASGYYVMYCPACDTIHSFGESWGFNKDFNDKPTVQGSLLVGKTATRDVVCHLFITNGSLHYLTDSTHSMSGKTVDLPEIPLDRFSFNNMEG